MDRVSPAPDAGELESLTSFLDFQRATIVRKVEGLDDAAAGRRAVPPSTLTLAGLVKHLSLVEESWFVRVFEGGELGEPWASAPFDTEPDWDFDSAADDSVADLISLYERACATSRDVVARAGSLDQMSVRQSRRHGAVSLRWIMLHMIDETARHAGHADLLREATDGETGI